MNIASGLIVLDNPLRLYGWASILARQLREAVTQRRIAIFVNSQTSQVNYNSMTPLGMTETSQRFYDSLFASS